MNMYCVKFTYRDRFSNEEWNNQSCVVEAEDELGALKECKKIYGLGIDCEYKIISVTIV